MPTRKSYYRKKAYVKRSYKSKSKGRTYRKKFSRKGGTGQNGRRFFKISFQGNFTASGAGVIVNQRTDDPSAGGDWASIAALFEEYRVCAIKIKYVPYAPNDPSGTRVFVPLFGVWDPNETGAVSSVQEILDHENFRALDMQKPWKWYQKIAKRDIGDDRSPGYTSTASPVAYGSIRFYGGAYTNSLQYGVYIQTIYLAAKNRD